MSRFRMFRAFIGGFWEQSASCGWYPLRDREGSIPPGVIDQEDHRDDCWPIRLLVLLTVAIVAWVVCA